MGPTIARTPQMICKSALLVALALAAWANGLVPSADDELVPEADFISFTPQNLQLVQEQATSTPSRFWMLAEIVESCTDACKRKNRYCDPGTTASLAADTEDRPSIKKALEEAQTYAK